MEPKRAALSNTPDLATEARVRASGLVDSLLEARTRRLRSTIHFGEFCQGLIGLGVPLSRSSLSISQLHPQLRARTMVWLVESGGAMEIGREHGIESTSTYLDSPIRRVHEGAETIRRRIADPDCPMDFPILAELKAEGFSDYFICCLNFSVGRNVIGFATKRPDGFTDRELALIQAALPAFAAVMEMNHLRRTASTLLETYLGPRTGAQVLAGAVKRGDGEVINAVLWYCDLRNFTELSETLPIDEVIGLLNDYFATMAEPVKAAGGEILKFIGDAMLAIFPLAGLTADGRCAACIDALDVATAALAGMDQLNERRRAAGQTTLRCGIALARGDVMYGNIGAQERLDFTVIGPAVNLATRLEDLTKDCDPPIIFDQQVAASAGRSTRELGRFKLKGIAEEQTAYTLA